MWSSLLHQHHSYGPSHQACGLPYWMNIMSMVLPIKHVVFPIAPASRLWSFPLSMWSFLLDTYYGYGLPYWIHIMSMVFPIMHVVFPIG